MSIDSWLILYCLYMAMTCTYIHIYYLRVGMVYQGSMCIDLDIIWSIHDNDVYIHTHIEYARGNGVLRLNVYWFLIDIIWSIDMIWSIHGNDVYMYIHICCVRVGMADQGSMCVDSWLILYGVYMPMTCTYTHNVCACVCVCVCVLIVDWYYLSLKFTAGMVLEGSMIPVIRPEAFMCVCVLIADRYYYTVWLFLGQGHLPREWRRKAQWFQSSGQRPLEWWCMCALHLDAIVPVCVCVLERECMGVCACVWLCACARYTLMPVYLCVCACVRERERETEREREIE